MAPEGKPAEGAHDGKPGGRGSRRVKSSEGPRGEASTPYGPQRETSRWGLGARAPQTEGPIMRSIIRIAGPIRVIKEPSGTSRRDSGTRTVLGDRGVGKKERVPEEIGVLLLKIENEPPWRGALKMKGTAIGHNLMRQRAGEAADRARGKCESDVQT